MTASAAMNLRRVMANTYSGPLNGVECVPVRGEERSAHVIEMIELELSKSCKLLKILLQNHGESGPDSTGVFGADPRYETALSAASIRSPATEMTMEQNPHTAASRGAGSIESRVETSSQRFSRRSAVATPPRRPVILPLTFVACSASNVQPDSLNRFFRRFA